MFKEHLANRVYRKLFYSIVTVGGITALIKLAAAGRDLILAHQFGTSGEYDAYLIAYAVPSFATNLIAGSIAAALIPVFIEVRTAQGREAAQRLLSSTLLTAAAMLSAISILLACSFRRLLPLIASGFPRAQADLTEALFWILLPGLLLGGMNLTCGAVLNASGCFVRVAAAPFLTPCLQLAFVLTTHGSRVQALAFGTTVGAAIEMGLLAWALHAAGYSFTPRWRGFGATGNVLGRQYLAMTIGGVLMGSTVIVDQSMSAMLGHGSV
jgi:putative peptidoglycan lipid II flippase